jgi:hypothetical protein
VEGRKRVRVKIGNHYKQHDPVHIIVNKIGYVRVRVRVCDRETDGYSYFIALFMNNILFTN